MVPVIIRMAAKAEYILYNFWNFLKNMEVGAIPQAAAAMAVG